MDTRELNATNCKTYLLVAGQDAALVDPVRERVETYAAVIGELGVTLRLILETHMHADHLMFSREIKDRFGVPVVMHRASPSPLVDRHVGEGDVIELGPERITVWHTPGHTPDSVCYLLDGKVLTGDTLLIGGSGRTDFPGGDSGAQYDGIQRLLSLPDDTVLLPGHDYRGNTESTIGAERATNPRLAGKSRREYVAIMAGLNLPVPDRIQEALQVNQSGFEAGEVAFPAVSEVAAAERLTAAELRSALDAGEPHPVVLDVREPEEFVGDLGHIEGALLVPLDSLARRLPKLAGYVDREIVVVCRAGARSATACAILSKAGFASIRNLEGGMLAWRTAGQATQR